MRFDEKLISLRKQKGFSQEDLGNKMGVSRQTISKWESGQTNPEMTKLKDLSQIFEISVDELINNEVELKKEEKIIKEEVKVNLKPTNVLIIISCVLIVLGFISSIIFYFLKKENFEIGSVVYINYITEYSDLIDITEIYTFDENDICISVNCYAICKNSEDSEKLTNSLNDSGEKVITNIVIKDNEVSWREKNYEKISLNKLIKSKENTYKDNQAFKIREL